jgi:hypothetical protein
VNAQAPPPRTIAMTVLASLITAGLALLLFVLPAEFAIDPTGLGDAIGITGMSGYTVSAIIEEDQAYVADQVEFVLGPFESIEYKYSLRAGRAMVYSWQAESELVYDFHSEEAGAVEGEAVSFSTGRSRSAHGTYVAPFDGIHGWFWENRGQQEVTVHLRTQGFYTGSTTFSGKGEYTRVF